jgi:hypothetical protein
MWRVQIDFVLNVDAWSARMLGSLAMLAAIRRASSRVRVVESWRSAAVERASGEVSHNLRTLAMVLLWTGFAGGFAVPYPSMLQFLKRKLDLAFRADRYYLLQGKAFFNVSSITKP